MYHGCGQVSGCRNGMLRHEYKCAATVSSQNVVRAIAMAFWRALFSHLIDLYSSFFVKSLLLPYTFSLLCFLQRRKFWSMRLYLFVCLSPFSTFETLTESVKRGVGITCLEKIRMPYSPCLAVGSINRIDERNFWNGLTILPLRILKLYNAIDLRKTMNLKWQHGGRANFLTFFFMVVTN